MNVHFFKSLTVLFTVICMSISCNKDKGADPVPGPTPNQDSRKVTYELSGNYSGKLWLVSSTNSGNLQEFKDIGLPWSQEIQYEKSVLGAGASVQTDGTRKGVPGQTVTLKVYFNSRLKDTKTATADAQGVINITMAFYTF